MISFATIASISRSYLLEPYRLEQLTFSFVLYLSILQADQTQLSS
jgi:hypothetical protein